MQSKLNENMISSFKNPFDDYNANVLDPESIMQYWFTPFSTGALKDFDEKRFFSQKMPIILQGSRGSGKTTILKYFSFPVQCERAHQNHISIRQQLLNDEGVGFYFRCDDSFLKEFKNVFSLAVEANWTACFEHYLELFFTKSLINFICTLANDYGPEFSRNILNASNLNELRADCNFDTIESFSEYIFSEIRYINTFKNESLFTQAKFNPKHIWSIYDISGKLIQAISKTVPELSKLNYLLLIDEFENLPIELQKQFNTMIKFCRSDISMRIGRRSENIVTKETINDVEYLREQHDYHLIILDQEQDIQSLRPYLLGIAEKRLEAMDVPLFPTNIIDILGDKEDLDAECQEVADDKGLHLLYILNSNPRIKSNEHLINQILSIIRYPKNRIAETLNALWVSRCEETEDPLDVAKLAASAMHAFLNKESHPLLAKYKNDYSNKYRYAITILICTAYRKDKLYYGFNALCHLSEGNARTFINLCKSIISDALFYERKNFLSTKRISFESQSRAIKSYSQSEFNSLCTTIQHGNSIRSFLLCLGNVFSEFHRDRLVRYPETNQFIFNPDELSRSDREILDIAISWSLIRRKSETQRLSASISKEGDIYTINKIFAPIFNISYRTRGGVNVRFSADEIKEMLNGEFKKSKLSTPTKRKRSSPTKDIKGIPPFNQLSLFDIGGTK